MRNHTLYISRDNAMEALGRDWPYVRALARKLGIPLRQPLGPRGASFIPADELVAAIEGSSAAPAAEMLPDDEPCSPEEVLRALGR